MANVISAAVLHDSLDVIDGYGKSASPCPSETTNMAPRYSDPINQ
ncbi:MAG: hypothetical protein PVG44_15860 [Desulfobacterales bacterium]